MGVISLREKDSIDFDPEASPWICGVYVLAHARGRDLAKTLCLKIEDYARDMGFDEIFLANEMGENSLYSAIGYKVYGDYFRHDHTEYLFRKKITS